MMVRAHTHRTRRTPRPRPDAADGERSLVLTHGRAASSRRRLGQRIIVGLVIAAAACAIIFEFAEIVRLR
ncbi:MAG: hypothetical protein ACREK8_11890 [Gemmatimonadales bacterium]